MLVNIENLKVHFDGDEELVMELLEVFESSYPETLRVVGRAIEEKNYPDLELHAHTLKGMIANFFADELKEAAFKLEKAGRDKIEDNLDEPFKTLTEKLPLVAKEVKENF